MTIARSSTRIRTRGWKQTWFEKRRLAALNRTRYRLSEYIRELKEVDLDQKLILKPKFRFLYRRLIVLRLQKPTRIKVHMKPFKPEILGHAWIIYYAALWREVDPWLLRHSYPLRFEFDPECEAAVQQVYAVGRSVQEQQEIWRELRSPIWLNLLLYLLRKSPERAPQFLQAVNMEPQPPAFVILDSLEYLGWSHAGRRKVLEPHEKPRDFVPAFFNLYRQNVPHFRIQMSQYLIRLVLILGTPNEQKMLYETLKSNDTPIRLNTLLHFANAFGRMGEYNLGMEVLNRASKCNVLVSARKFLMSCSVVLRGSVLYGKAYHATSEIVARLMQMGVELNYHLYAILIHNAVDAGDLQTAFRIYNLMEEAGIDRGDWILETLLKGCKKAADPTVFMDFASHCAQSAKTRNRPWLATEVLHYLYVCNLRSGNKDTFKIVAEAYRNFFNPQPLIDLGVLKPLFQRRPGEHLLRPSSATLYIMIAADIQTSGQVREDAVMYRMYKDFRGLVQQGHVFIAPLAETTHTYNAFLYQFCSRPSMLKHATQIIRDMTSELLPTAYNYKKGRPIKQAQPDVITWNIFMNGFVKARQMAAAEKVLDLMKKRNLKPDRVTWETLLYGYAGAQRTNKAVEIIKQIEGDGGEMTPRTVSVLSKIRDREGLMQALELIKSKSTSEGESEVENYSIVQNEDAFAKSGDVVRALEQIMFRPRMARVLSRPTLKESAEKMARRQKSLGPGDTETPAERQSSESVSNDEQTIQRRRDSITPTTKIIKVVSTLNNPAESEVLLATLGPQGSAARRKQEKRLKKPKYKPKPNKVEGSTGRARPVLFSNDKPISQQIDTASTLEIPSDGNESLTPSG